MKTVPTLLIAAAALLLPSCIKWTVGEHVYNAGETFVGYDYCKPLDGKVYCKTAKDGTRRYFARLNEVRYHKQPKLVYMTLGFDFDEIDKEYDASNIELTGRSIWAELDVDSISAAPAGEGRTKPSLRGCQQEVSALPKGAVLLPLADYEYSQFNMNRAGRYEPDSSPGGFRRAVAAGLSYTVDPLLSFSSTVIHWSGYCTVGLVCSPFIYMFEQINESQQQPEVAPAAENTPASPTKAPASNSR